jgi:O-antigen ligase
MSLTAAAPVRRTLDVPALLDRVGIGATLILPLFLLHGRSLAEAALAVVAFCFLLRSALLRRWDWVRRGWVPIGLAWWVWLVVCSTPVPALDLGLGGWPSFLQALAMGRFVIFAAALEFDVLRDPARRLWLWRVIAAAAAYIAAQALLQFAIGTNLYGYPRNVDGELTGPFPGPRAGPPFARILLPVIVPPIAALLDRGRAAASAAALALLLGGVAVVVLIGQRMPLAIALLGIAVTALLLRRLRPIAVIAVIAAFALVAATPVISPRTSHRLVDEFSHQIEQFGSTQYAHIYVRSLAIAQQHPITGRGFNGYRTGCPEPRYAAPSIYGLSNTAPLIFCTTHPHSFYVQALTDSGVPGLLLFVALAIAWLREAGRGLWRDPRPLRVGLFAAMVLQLWPIASTSSFAVMPMSGWFFLLLGFALAAARAATAAEPA